MTSRAAPPAALHVEKLMSLSRAEFDKGVLALGDGALETADGRVSLAVGAGRAEISFHALAPKRLGGLLLLPQARVVVVVEGLDEVAAVEFLRRFDLAFQRGGG